MVDQYKEHTRGVEARIAKAFESCAKSLEKIANQNVGIVEKDEAENSETEESLAENVGKAIEVILDDENLNLLQKHQSLRSISKSLQKLGEANAG